MDTNLSVGQGVLAGCLATLIYFPLLIVMAPIMSHNHFLISAFFQMALWLISFRSVVLVGYLCFKRGSSKK